MNISSTLLYTRLQLKDTVQIRRPYVWLRKDLTLESPKIEPTKFPKLSGSGGFRIHRCE